jgi:hypothetical protein
VIRGIYFVNISSIHTPSATVSCESCPVLKSAEISHYGVDEFWT